MVLPFVLQKMRFWVTQGYPTLREVLRNMQKKKMNVSQGTSTSTFPHYKTAHASSNNPDEAVNARVQFPGIVLGQNYIDNLAQYKEIVNIILILIVKKNNYQGSLKV